MNETAINILWTGGLDSTFRILFLLHSGQTVRPHENVDSERPSTECEKRAMELNRSDIAAEPLAGSLLPSTVSLKPRKVRNAEIINAYNLILRESYIGEQYMWLAEYCVERGIQGMEIGVENNPIIKKAIENKGWPYSAIFGAFTFPIISTDKVEMKRWAGENGVLHILERSWFCHTPTRGSCPCGDCHPCAVSIAGGM